MYLDINFSSKKFMDYTVKYTDISIYRDILHVSLEINCNINFSIDKSNFMKLLEVRFGPNEKHDFQFNLYEMYNGKEICIQYEEYNSTNKKTFKKILSKYLDILKNIELEKD